MCVVRSKTVLGILRRGYEEEVDKLSAKSAERRCFLSNPIIHDNYVMSCEVSSKYDPLARRGLEETGFFQYTLPRPGVGQEIAENHSFRLLRLCDVPHGRCEVTFESDVL